ncbi:MAG: 2-amino-4-hydroxy-6-hydroxymethyldihydropteridine diphosphokinase [Saccharofermentans sp.]|nr:2-amino-4-hydroxy-6-hydroxymethyldihydropteridine diphosphokinase [Saccharofermentans sp.]
MGDKIEHLKAAARRLEADPHISHIKAASLYETSPVGYLEQDDFINTCLGFFTDLEPEELLRLVMRIEKEGARERLIHWGPRTIDIDIILYGDMSYESPDLIIPHPRYKQRAFVLAPLSELTGEEYEMPEDQQIRRIGQFEFN